MASNPFIDVKLAIEINSTELIKYDVYYEYIRKIISAHRHSSMPA